MLCERGVKTLLLFGVPESVAGWKGRYEAVQPLWPRQTLFQYCSTLEMALVDAVENLDLELAAEAFADLPLLCGGNGCQLFGDDTATVAGVFGSAAYGGRGAVADDGEGGAAGGGGEFFRESD